MKRFALIGAAGYVAPRHMKAIKETGNDLIAILDPCDSVGVIDSYFPKAKYFKEFERFDRYLDKIKRQGEPIDWISICSPNYLHDAHCRYGLRYGADVICEKPLVLNPWNVDGLIEMERDTGKRIFNILQLRHHASVKQVKAKIANEQKESIYQVKLRYITPRGSWYRDSWKGDVAKSGGITSNIGVHLFDILLWLFGAVVEVRATHNSATGASGHLRLEKANIEWELSINADDLPKESNGSNSKAYRSLIIDEEVIDLSAGFEDLHTLSYQEILNGQGVGISEIKGRIQLLHELRGL